MLSSANLPLINESLRHQLRQATAEAHARLDATLTGFDLQSLPGYRRFLEVSAAALIPLENALADAGIERLFPDWPSRTRRDAILADLTKVGGQFEAMPPLKPLNFGGMLGIMYVLEGSRLGATVLLKTVERSTDPQVAGATAYLRHGSGRRLWQNFLQALETHTNAVHDEADAIAGADQAFALFEQSAARRQDAAQLAE